MAISKVTTHLMLGERRTIRTFPSKKSAQMWPIYSRSPTAYIIITQFSLKN